MPYWFFESFINAQNGFWLYSSHRTAQYLPLSPQALRTLCLHVCCPFTQDKEPSIPGSTPLKKTEFSLPQKTSTVSNFSDRCGGSCWDVVNAPSGVGHVQVGIAAVDSWIQQSHQCPEDRVLGLTFPTSLSYNLFLPPTWCLYWLVLCQPDNQIRVIWKEGILIGKMHP